MKKKKFRKKGLFALLLLCLFIMSASVTVSARQQVLCQDVDLTEIQKINHPVQTEKPKMYRSW